MKSIGIVVLVLLCQKLNAIEPQSLKHFESVPPQVRLHFTNFCLGNYDALFANNEAGFSQLASAPGLTSALVELADLHEAAQEWDGFTRAWGLLAQRTDATNDEQRYVREKLQATLNKNADPGGSSLKASGLTFLGHYPTIENRELLIQYLNDTNGGPLHADLSEEAASSLGKIGDASSIQALQEYAKKRQPPPGAKSRFYEAAVASLDKIKARIETTPTPKLPPVVQPPAPKKSPEAKPAPTPSEEPTSSTPWSIIVILIVAALSLLWLLVKNRK